MQLVPLWRHGHAKIFLAFWKKYGESMADYVPWEWEIISWDALCDIVKAMPKGVRLAKGSLRTNGFRIG